MQRSPRNLSYAGKDTERKPLSFKGYIDPRVGQKVELKKAHPCGENHWTVSRIGADIGLACKGCNARVMLTRSDYEKRFKRILNES